MARYRVIPDRSRLLAKARSSVHPITVETTGLTGTIEAEVEGQAVRLGAPFRVEIDAERLRSGNALIDGDLQRRLETRKFPRVVGAVKMAEARSDGVRWILRGELTVHGVTKAENADVTVRVVDDRTLEIEGEKVIDMRDYGLKPPRLLMLRVHPDVTVRAVLVAEREE